MSYIPPDVGSRVGDAQVFESRQTRRRFLVHLVVAGLVLAVLAVLAHRHLAFLADAERARAFVRGYGLAAPLVLATLQALQVIVAPVPGQVLALAGGYLFGPLWGTVYNMVGITIGSAVAFWLARRFGRAYVEGIVHDDALSTFDAVDEDSARASLFVLFLVPGLPDDLLCFLGGLTTIPLWQLVAIAIVGRTPAFFLVNVVGDLAGTGQVPEALALTAAIVAVAVLGYAGRERLVGVVDALRT